MKHLLAAVDSHAGEHEAVFAFLGGQRQRYGYFGFQPAGYHMDCSVSRANVRHALSGCDDGAVQIVPMEQSHIPAAIALHTAQTMYCTRSEDNFLNIARTWYLSPYAILINGEMTGFAIMKAGGDTATVDELRLKSERTLPSVIKKLSGVFGNLKFNVAPCDTERAGYLTTLAENWQITRDHMFKFYHEERLRDMMRDAGLPSSAPLYFNGFTLPLPLFMSSPDSV